MCNCMKNIDPNIGRILIFNESTTTPIRGIIGVVIDVEHEYSDYLDKNIIVFKTYEYVENRADDSGKFWELSSWKHVYDCKFDDNSVFNCKCPVIKFL